MPLADCTTATGLETIDSTLTLSSVTISAIALTESGTQIPGIGATWAASTNPYVTGIQFEYQESGLASGAVRSAPQGNALASWSSTVSIVTGKTYLVRWRAVGDLGRNVFGDWSSPGSITTSAAMISGSASSVTWSAVTGSGKPSDYATVGARSGTNLFRNDGMTVLTQAEVRTAEGVAASIASQGALATASSADWRTQVGNRPAIAEQVLTFDFADLTAATAAGYTFSPSSVVSFVDTGEVNGRAAQIGDNSGNDQSIFFGPDWTAYNSADLYEVVFDIEYLGAGASNVLLAGVQAYDRAGNNLGAAYNYVVASNLNVQANLLGRRTLKGYLSGWTAAAGSGLSNDPLAPAGLPDGSAGGFGQGGAVKFRPVGVFNYNAQPGQVIVHSVRVNRIAGALATQTNVLFGSSYLLESLGGATASLANFKTSSGTAAAIAGQGALATLSSVLLDSQVSEGTTYKRYAATEQTKLAGVATGATVGARSGTNLFRNDGMTVLTQAEVRTAEGVAASITGQAAWATSALATARLNNLSDTGVFNDLANVTTRPLSALTGRTADLVTFVTGGATVDSLKPGEAGANVTETRVAASITGQGALATANSAIWTSQVSARPVELTDGRVATAVNASGYLQSGLNAEITSAEMLAGITGAQLSANPEFLAGVTTGYVLYNNAGGTKLVMSVETDSTAPNGSRRRLKLAYDGTGTPGTNPTPGYGGVIQTLNYAGAGVVSRPGFYAANTRILYRIWANIPVGRTLNQTSNSTGAEGGFTWLTSNEGTGGWFLYMGIRKIGTTGTFASSGHLYITDGTNAAFNWYIAKYEQIDITGSARSFLGRTLLDSTGVPRFDADLITVQGTASSITGQGALAVLSAVGTSQITDGSVSAVKIPAGVIDYSKLTTTAGRLGTNLVRNDGTTSLTDALAVTSLGTAAAIAGQGALATTSTAAWATQVSGRPAELTDGRVTAGLDSSGDLARNLTTARANSSALLRFTGGGLFTGELAADVTGSHVAASITGQGALAVLNAVGSAQITDASVSAVKIPAGVIDYSKLTTTAGRLGTNLVRNDGTTSLTDALAVTSLGTAAAISGQADWATYTTRTPAQLAAAIDTSGDLLRNVKTNKVVTDSISTGAVSRITSHKSVSTTIDIVNANAADPDDRVLAKSLTFTVDDSTSTIVVTFVTQIVLGAGDSVYFYLKANGATTATWAKTGSRGYMSNADDVTRIKLSANDEVSHVIVHEYEGTLTAGSNTMTVYVNCGGSATSDLLEPAFVIEEVKKAA